MVILLHNGSTVQNNMLITTGCVGLRWLLYGYLIHSGSAVQNNTLVNLDVNNTLIDLELVLHNVQNNTLVDLDQMSALQVLCWLPFILEGQL